VPDASRLSKLAGGCVPYTVVGVGREEGPILIGNLLKRRRIHCASICRCMSNSKLCWLRTASGHTSGRRI